MYYNIIKSVKIKNLIILSDCRRNKLAPSPKAKKSSDPGSCTLPESVHTYPKQGQLRKIDMLGK